MNITRRFLGLAGAALLSTAAFVPSTVLAAQHALLIGVADYKDPRVKDLRFPEQDVAAFPRYLIAKPGFESGDIETLLSAQAVRCPITFPPSSTKRNPGTPSCVTFPGTAHPGLTMTEMNSMEPMKCYPSMMVTSMTIFSVPNSTNSEPTACWSFWTAVIPAQELGVPTNRQRPASR